ncbi:MAG: acyltransferase family protein [Hyphomicrobiaceae bacterium]|nr:acyltransferase family protein [Hyphomicrobiaceae bacterium]
MQTQPSPARVPWVDYAKGICIVMVVMMHSTLGVEAAAGAMSWMHELVAFATPFRMPDFFLIAGLFLARRIDRDWPDYLDRKVLHFAYFYVLWLTIQFALKAPLIMSEAGVGGVFSNYAEAYVQPFGTLWFIYLLPVFFVVTKGLRSVSPVLVWLAAAALEISDLHTGSTIVDEFASRFVYFYSGYVLAPYIFRLAEKVDAEPVKAMAALGVWALVNGIVVKAGYAGLPFISLVLGFAGVGAIVAASVLLTRVSWGEALRYCGENSIVIYLAFTIPMAATRMVLLKLGLIPDLGTVSLLVTIAGLTGALILHWIVRNTPLAFLFVRPRWARLEYWREGDAARTNPQPPSAADAGQHAANR